MEIFKLFGTIGIDANKPKKSIDEVTKHAKSSGKLMESSFSNFNTKMSNGIQKVTSGMASGLDFIGSSASKVGSALNKKITVPATIATSALAGIALKKGWDRLIGIDDARAKLMGLGHDAKAIEAIMDSALKSVKGTSFGMDEAATTAANAVAAGVKQGEDLTNYLKLTADAAAIAGVSMSEMGSIMNKVQTGGRAMTENLEQLSDRGLPVYQWLAEEAGVAADAVKDMASKGEISSEMFYKAIEKNIGGAAAIMGENSFKASIANIWASVGRIGANFLDAGGKGGGFFSTIKPLLADFNKSLESVEELASDLGVKFGESFRKAIDFVVGLKAKFDELSPSAQNSLLKTIGSFAGLAVAAGPALKVFGGFSTVLGKAMGAIGTFNGAIGGLVTTFTSGLGGMGTNLVGFSGLLIQILGPAAILGVLLAGLGLAQSQFGEQIDSFMMMVATKGPEIITNLGNGITQALPNLVTKGAELIVNLVNAITANLPSIFEQGVSIIVTLVQSVGDNLPMLFESGLQLIESILTGIIMSLPNLILAGLDLVMSLIDGIISSLPTLITTIINLIQVILQQIVQHLPLILEKGVEIVLKIVNGIVNALPEIIQAIVQLIQVIVKVIVDNLPMLLQKGIEIVGRIAAGLINALPSVSNAIWELVRGIFNIMGSVNWIDLGINIVRGIANGIYNFAGEIWNALSSVVSSAWENAKSFLGIHSPSRLFRDTIGKPLPQGVAVGIDDEGYKVQDSLDDITKDLSFDPDLSADVSLGANSLANQNNNTNSPLLDAINSLKGMIQDMRDNPVVVNVNNDANEEWLRSYITYENVLDGITKKF